MIDDVQNSMDEVLRVIVVVVVLVVVFYDILSPIISHYSVWSVISAYNLTSPMHDN